MTDNFERRRVIMQTTGFIRSIDSVGRVVLPVEIRKRFDLLDNNSSVEIFVDDDGIVLKKYKPTCIFCGSDSNLCEYMGKKICAECSVKIGNI